MSDETLQFAVGITPHLRDFLSNDNRILTADYGWCYNSYPLPLKPLNVAGESPCEQCDAEYLDLIYLDVFDDTGCC